jgi:two-component system OmpR family response regulator
MQRISPAPQQKTKRILVVEDEGEMRLILDIILHDKNFELEFAGDLLSADEYLQKFRPDLILLDNKLPDGFGVDFISYIRKKYPAVKIIMISGFASVRDVALENGADMFFEKPFSLEEFYEAIGRLIDE